MSNKKPKLFTHGCYIGTTGFNNHTRDFFRELSKNYEIKVRNFTVGKHWKGLEDEPFNKEEYLTSSDKILLEQQTYFNNEHELNDFPIYQKYSNNFDHDLNIVLAEVNHHYFYQNYEGPKIMLVKLTRFFIKSFASMNMKCNNEGNNNFVMFYLFC